MEVGRRKRSARRGLLGRTAGAMGRGRYAAATRRANTMLQDAHSRSAHAASGRCASLGRSSPSQSVVRPDASSASNMSSPSQA